MKARLFDTVQLVTQHKNFPSGTLGAVVEVYTTPQEGYDVEIVDDEGKTLGLITVHPEEIEVVSPVRFDSIQVDSTGSHATVRFSDGKEVVITAEEVYSKKI